MHASAGARRVFAIAAVATAASCHRPPEARLASAAPLAQAAYVWQRGWTPAVREAVAHPLAALDGLRVLAAEVDGPDHVTLIHLDPAALAAAHRPITLVLRIDGARPIAGLSLASLVVLGAELRAGGVDVTGIEVDHDCATARLAAYAAWLTAQRPAAPWRLSITALPTWSESPALADVAAAVDELVVQVHAVRAPTIFDADAAWRDLGRFARAIADARARRVLALRVALPTYGALVGGLEVRAEPDQLAAFVRRLEARPIDGVDGIVWFRLPVVGDAQTWSAAMFARVVTGQAPTGRAEVALLARGADRFDVVITNPGDAPVDLPPVRVEGDVADAELVQGYRALGPGRWEAPRRPLAGHARLVIGWLTGKDVQLVE
jgi:hypothetical protein